MNPDDRALWRTTTSYAAELFAPDVVAREGRRGRVITRAVAAGCVAAGLIGGGVVVLFGGSGAWILPAIGIVLAIVTLLLLPAAWDRAMGLRVNPDVFDVTPLAVYRGRPGADKCPAMGSLEDSDD